MKSLSNLGIGAAALTWLLVTNDLLQRAFSDAATMVPYCGVFVVRSSATLLRRLRRQPTR